MVDLVQCPNCGGYRVNITGRSPIIVGYSPVSTRQNIIGIIAMVVVVPLIIGILAFIGLSIADVWGLLIGVGIGGFLVWKLIQSEKNKNKRGNPDYAGYDYSYSCDICGYKWSWSSGKPLPKVSFRPDLIAAFEQRLEEARQEEIANRVAQDILNRKP